MANPFRISAQIAGIALSRELGLVNTIRFLNQFTTGFGNYTEERRGLLEQQTVDEAFADLRRYQANRIPRQQDIIGVEHA